VVVVSARIHPGETPASFIVHGFIDFVTSQDPRALLLRDHIVFKAGRQLFVEHLLWPR
jgi:hypothetical protein